MTGDWGLRIGDWGLGDWGLGTGDWDWDWGLGTGDWGTGGLGDWGTGDWDWDLMRWDNFLIGRMGSNHNKRELGYRQSWYIAYPREEKNELVLLLLLLHLFLLILCHIIYIELKHMFSFLLL